MTRDEIVLQLMELDIDFEILTEHNENMNVIIKFDQEDEKVITTKKLGLAIDGFAE